MMGDNFCGPRDRVPAWVRTVSEAHTAAETELSGGEG